MKNKKIKTVKCSLDDWLALFVHPLPLEQHVRVPEHDRQYVLHEDVDEHEFKVQIPELHNDI